MNIGLFSLDLQLLPSFPGLRQRGGTALWQRARCRNDTGTDIKPDPHLTSGKKRCVSWPNWIHELSEDGSDGFEASTFLGTIGCSIFPLCHPVSPIFGGDNASDGSQERRDPRELFLGMPPGGCELSVSLIFSWSWPRKNCTLCLFDPFLEDLRCFLLRMGIFRSYVQFPQGKFIRIGPSSMRCHQIRSSSVVSHCITSGGWHWKSIGNRSEITPEGSSPLR